MYKDRLKYLRDEKDLKQNTLATILNIHPDRYSCYETENEIMPIKHLNTLANYFSVSLDYIFNFTDTKQYNNSSLLIDKNKSKLKIKEIRKINNLTQIKLAAILNIGKGTIAEYERGTNIIATPFLYDICTKYQISADYLLSKIDYIPNWCNNIYKNNQ